MVVQALAFYLFAIIAVISAAMVVTVRNPVHSVLFLILTFFNAAGLFVLLGAEFLAMLLVVVYVGAIAVLFMFVVMMLDINFVEMREGFLSYLPIGVLVAAVLFVELAFVGGGWVMTDAKMAAIAQPVPADMNNINALGMLLYTDYAYIFQAAGLVLLTAMIGAIVLTLRHRKGVRRQNISQQVQRQRAETLEIKKVPVGRGI
ncbi:NADH:ubiquinone oxidoreductase subunit J [Thalassospira profundimaris]|jgi:NADH-quinone oxidoreductase subunit J|uniref:NADH-quinone oxidoreductase subunit J n=1 Tax=Thalassospira profundimaris TaxID=502049 RepID=A0A367XFR9_9PROT|nr:NADH-quinone oxidoreductase subunit J [Thalassospira profundimaris]RCK52508.1 NADH:ubiquinone oxidoreductase subunit J [Thalassospira profundimaris]